MFDLTEQSLNQYYETFSKEHSTLLNDMKTNTNVEDASKDRDTIKQLTLLNSLMVSVLKLRNLRKQILLKV